MLCGPPLLVGGPERRSLGGEHLELNGERPNLAPNSSTSRAQCNVRANDSAEAEVRAVLSPGFWFVADAAVSLRPPLHAESGSSADVNRCASMDKGGSSTPASRSPAVCAGVRMTSSSVSRTECCSRVRRRRLLTGARTERCVGRSPDVYAMPSGAAAVAGTDSACGSDGSVDPRAVGR
jgi:hypothetical protein